MSRAKAQAAGADRPRDFLNDLMRAIDREVTRQAALAVERSGIRGLTAAHGRLMAEVEPTGTRPSQLAARLGVTKAAVGQLVDKLEKKGLVVRAPDPEDGRAVIVRPTEKAKMAYQTARKAIVAIETEWRERLGDARTGALERALLGLKAWSEESERRGPEA
jgi:DNA-binding MarR family transcriptional regulator